MKTFARLNTVATFKNCNLLIAKVQKVGTKRTFFRIENSEGQTACRTLFARLYDAERTIKNHIEKAQKAA